jgi:general secretion pathway protein G
VRRIGIRNEGRGGERGLTYIELLAVVGILAILAASAIPMVRWNEKRRREAELRSTLALVRDAIDLYHKYSENGLIQQTDVEQMNYPRSLDELVEGVEVGDPQSPVSKKMTFLNKIPVDPMTGDTEWGLRSYQDDWDSDSWGGENVYDIYSLATGEALDGTHYNEW